MPPNPRTPSPPDTPGGVYRRASQYFFSQKSGLCSHATGRSSAWSSRVCARGVFPFVCVLLHYGIYYKHRQARYGRELGFPRHPYLRPCLFLRCVIVGSICRLIADFRRFGLGQETTKGNGIQSHLRCILRDSRRMKDNTQMILSKNDVKHCGERVCEKGAKTVYRAIKKSGDHRQGGGIRHTAVRYSFWGR